MAGRRLSRCRALSAVGLLVSGLLIGSGDLATAGLLQPYRPGTPLPRSALIPNSIAFSDPSDGIAGTGSTDCVNSDSGCRPEGTISLTVDGGRTWKVVLRTTRPVLSVQVDRSGYRAVLDNAHTLTSDAADDENIRSTDGGLTWYTAQPPSTQDSPCLLAVGASTWLTSDPNVQVVALPDGREWALCTGQPTSGAQPKAVYRSTPNGWERVASGLVASRSQGFGLEGYANGIAMSGSGFGLIWEDRGPLLATHDAGSHWAALPKVADGDDTTAWSASVFSSGIGFALLDTTTVATMRSNSVVRRLVDTTDAGRSWHVVHRWHYLHEAS